MLICIITYDTLQTSAVYVLDFASEIKLNWPYENDFYLSTFQICPSLFHKRNYCHNMHRMLSSIYM